MSLFSDNFIAKCHLFDNMSQAEIALFQQRCTKYDYNGNTVVIKEGEDSKYLYILLHGTLRVTKKLPFNATETTLCTYHPGCFFGELAFLDGQKRSATITTTSHCKLVKISTNALMNLIQDTDTIRLFGKLMTNIAIQLADNLRATNDLLLEALYGEYQQAKDRIDAGEQKSWEV